MVRRSISFSEFNVAEGVYILKNHRLFLLPSSEDKIVLYLKAVSSSMDFFLFVLPLLFFVLRDRKRGIKLKIQLCIGPHLTVI